MSECVVNSRVMRCLYRDHYLFDGEDHREFCYFFFFFFQAEDGIRDVERSRGLGDVYKRQVSTQSTWGPTVIEDLKKTCDHFIDLSYLEKEDLFLEGKGAVIYDLRNNKIYVCLSERAKLKAVEIYVEELNKISSKPWKIISFSGKDRKGDTIYHTDCMLQLLADHALLSGSSLSVEEKKIVMDELTNPEKNLIPYSVIELSFDEVEHMCCNILNVLSSKNEKVLLMSEQAYENYSKEHRDLLSKHYKLVHTDVSTVEANGGGSTRCMLAEYFQIT
eukprot:TRINITY_DN1180_c0_g1_i3.p1 TRINITY_DN1180_c0_g1~~TRINITY_DN1180_c0_g1_i3.p1  ORF type:complete len:276 (-),score=46.89 TRINITY_DN1180_c0_g1_i3:8-835(-)